MTIDICVPFWGDPEKFLKTIASVQAQSDPDWRLTIIDDGYPGTVVEDHVASLADERISYQRNPQNVGIIENFRRAIAASQGTHVVVLGSDDLLLSNYVEHVHQTIIQYPNVDIIQPGVQVIDGDGVPARTLVDSVKHHLLTPRPGTILTGEDFAKSMLVGNWLYWPSLVFRNEAIQGIDFRDGWQIILDLAFLIDISMKNGSLVYTGVEAFQYRRHGESLSQVALRDGSRFEDERAFYREIAARAESMNWSHAARAARWRVMSRLHALTQLPRVLVSGSPAARKATWLLAVGA